MKGNPSASLQGAQGRASLRTCPRGHETCWPNACPACRALRFPSHPKKPLTAKQNALMAHISAFRDACGHYPTHREISRDTGKSLTAIHSMLHTLQKNGWVQIDTYGPRGLHLRETSGGKA